MTNDNDEGHDMRITITVDLDNEAFADNAGDELARIMRAFAARIDDGPLYPGRLDALLDVNGNTVGDATVHDDRFPIADTVQSVYATTSSRLTPDERRVFVDAVKLLQELGA